MMRKISFERVYGPKNAEVILASIGKVASAGRWKDQREIEAERSRHYDLMKSLP